MDNSNPIRNDHTPETAAPDEETSSASRDKVYHFQPRSEPASEQPSHPERRDWAAAIDLVKEASEAVRLAEERAQAAEDYSKQLAAYHKEQIRAAEARTANAERRVEAALLRATEAETWLTRFHDAILDGFGHPEKV